MSVDNNADACSAIPAIQSAYLNLKTAISDCESAMCEWEVCQWPCAIVFIENAQSQLASAKAKIEAHVQKRNSGDEPRPTEQR